MKNTARLALLWLAASAVVPAAPQQVFRASVDLIPVDVQVLDADGRPIVGLQAKDFDVAIDRKARRVVAVDFRHYNDLQPSTSLPPSSPRARSDATPMGESQRIFVLAIDAHSLSDTESSGLVRALEGFVAQLSADDSVGFFTLPHGPSLRPTTNRAALRKVISSIVGGEGLRASPSNLSPVEVAEIVNSPSNPTGSSPTTPKSSPLPPNPDDMLRQLQVRECGSLNDRACTTNLTIEAETIQRQLEQEVSESIGGIRALLAGLRDYQGPKTVVLASSGMPLSDRPGGWNSSGGEARNIGEDAARSRVSIYSLHIDRGLNRKFAPQVRDIRITTSSSRDLEQRVLYDLAASSGGALFSAAVDAGESALNRVLLETSSIYLLGVSPEKLDIDGQTHALTVKLKPNIAGSITRHRKFVVLSALPKV